MEIDKPDESQQVAALLTEYAEKLRDKAEEILTTKAMPMEDRSAVWQTLYQLAHRAELYAGHLTDVGLRNGFKSIDEELF